MDNKERLSWLRGTREFPLGFTVLYNLFILKLREILRDSGFTPVMETLSLKNINEYLLTLCE